MSSLDFYLHDAVSADFNKLIDDLREYSKIHKKSMYVVDSPLVDTKYNYDFKEKLILLVPGSKIALITKKELIDSDEFIDFVDDFVEDVASISDNYEYKTVLGRARQWKDKLVTSCSDEFKNVESLLKKIALEDDDEKRQSQLLISLITGSINNIQKVGHGVPQTLLEKVKRKIQLFDADQTSFIYKKVPDKVISIQGLSGTGKTELLMHKLKDLYLEDGTERMIFTCHNKVLAADMKGRIKTFFNFMKVKEQIEWESKLWCVNSWGSGKDPNSGTYRIICDKFGIPFETFSYKTTFGEICERAITFIKNNTQEGNRHIFDYCLIDESQDLPKSFVNLCSLVTKKKVYVAGDIFQTIFDNTFVNKTEPHFLLNKVYRTDPRTFMFAHGVGMGLFEKDKINWLDEDQWGMCGYKVKRGKGNLILTREPLRRFEDLGDENFRSVVLVDSREDYPNMPVDDLIIKLISDIKGENATVQAGDIGVVYIGPNDEYHQLAAKLEFKLPGVFGWELNSAVVTKRTDSSKLFFSNQNNVKGLEFPFFICVQRSITESPINRNSLYMLMTRSFLRSYLVITGAVSRKKLVEFSAGLREINTTGQMTVEIPDAAQQARIKTRIEKVKTAMSFKEFATDIFDTLNVPKKQRDLLSPLLHELFEQDEGRDKAISLVKTNMKLLRNEDE